MLSRRLAGAVLVIAALVGCAGNTVTSIPTTSASNGATSSATGASGIPVFDHVVVVIFENRATSQILGEAPYISSLAAGGANFTNFFAETHPSQPNYFALFSGGTQGTTSDACPPHGAPYGTANLASELIDAGRSWGSFNESLSAEGSTACGNAKGYARKHNPWFSFTNVPADTGHTFAQWPTDFGTLPTVSFVIPNLCHDMHNCAVGTGDTWLKRELGSYARWAATHNSLLVVTFDEDDKHHDNRIATIFSGAHVRPGTYRRRLDHYNLLRTIEDLYGTGHAGRAASAEPISGVWQ
jgi:arylsulfatase A-like enzyme